MNEDLCSQMRESWRVNAQGWIDAVRGGSIQSRRLATDAAIVEAVLSLRPRRVVDLGCGEGWLTRALTRQGISAVGVDGSPELIAAALAARQGHFIAASYAELAADPLRAGKDFDTAIFNFSLLDEQAGAILSAVPRLLAPQGFLVVQTVHPWSGCGDAPYRSAWRVESFGGFGDGFSMPMPWYYRTMQDWLSLLRESGFEICALREPSHPESGLPLSMIFTARLAGCPASTISE